MKEENKEEKITKKPKTPDNSKLLKNGILSIIGSIFHKIALGSIFVSLGFSSYMISYLHHFQDPDDKPLTQQHTYFLMPILSVTMGLGIPFSGVLEFKLGTQRTIILGSIFLISSSAIQFVSHSFYLNLLGIFMFAIGLAISIAIPGKNACMYFPTKRGMVTGLLSLVSAIVSSILNIFGEKVIINPKSIDPKEGYYLYDVSKNICNFYLFQMGCVGVCTLLCILFIVPFQMKGNMAFMKKGMKKDIKKEETKKTVKDIETKKEKEKEEPLLPEEKEEEKKEEKNENKVEKKENENVKDKKENENEN
jgi:MFS family permease